MTTDRHETIGVLLDEYAFGQLSPDERRDVERHVGECDACAADLRELTTVMEGLAQVADPIAPPPALKARVLATLGGLSQEPPRPRGDAPRALRGPAGTVVRRQGHPAWLAVAAAVIFGLAALLYLNALSRQRLADEVANARMLIADLQQRLDQNTAHTALTIAILTASDMQPIALSGREDATGSTARAYWSPTRGLLLVADNLPVPPPGRIYQVWLIGGSGPVSAGVLGAPNAGRGMLIVPPPAGTASGAITVAVTDEPPGGLPAPTGAMRLVGSL